MDFVKILLDPSLWVGAVMSPIVKMGIDAIRSFPSTTRKANNEYGRMLANHVIEGGVPSMARVRSLKSALAQKYKISINRFDDIYTTLANVYCEYMSTDFYTEDQKKKFEQNFKKYARYYREQQKNEETLLRTFLIDSGSVTAIMFILVFGYAIFTDSNLSFQDYMVIAIILLCYSVILNLLIQPPSYYFEKRRIKKKIRRARRIVKDLCRSVK